MNATSHAENRSLQLVEVVDLKWLLAGEGHHVHVERLMADPAYAQECLALAEASANGAIRAVASRLRRHLPATAA